MKIEEKIEKYLTEEKAELYPMEKGSSSARFAGKFAIVKGGKVYDPLMKNWISLKAVVHMSDWDGLMMSEPEAKKLLQGIK